MKTKLIIPLLLSLLLCGCSYIEPDAQYTVTAIGFEGGVQDRLYLQMNDPARSTEASSVFSAQGKGKNPSDALDDIRSSLSKTPSFGHCQIIVVSSEVGRESLNRLLELCIELGTPLGCPIVCTKQLESFFEEKGSFTGGDAAALLNKNAEYFGYGAHTALFEIKTALLMEESKFALPILEIRENNLKINGLHYFSRDVAELGGVG